MPELKKSHQLDKVELKIDRTKGSVTLFKEWLSENYVLKVRRDGQFGFINLPFDETISEKITSVRNEYVLQVTGKVVERESKNKNIPTGEIEIEVEIEINVKVYWWR